MVFSVLGKTSGCGSPRSQIGCVFLRLIRASIIFSPRAGQFYDFEDPSDTYLAAWLKERDAQRQWLSRKEKLKLLAEAFSLIDGVSLFEPDWKPRLVEQKKHEIRAGVGKALLLEEREETFGGFEMPVFQTRRRSDHVPDF